MLDSNSGDNVGWKESRERQVSEMVAGRDPKAEEKKRRDEGEALLESLSCKDDKISMIDLARVLSRFVECGDIHPSAGAMLVTMASTVSKLSDEDKKEWIESLP